MAEFVSFVLNPHNPETKQLIHEGKRRLALFDKEHGCWRLMRKVPHVWNNPLSDWDYEDLVYACAAIKGRECDAIRWVVEGNKTPV